MNIDPEGELLFQPWGNPVLVHLCSPNFEFMNASCLYVSPLQCFVFRALMEKPDGEMGV